MRIICENCQAAYLVSPKVIGESGRLVKCAKCSYIWLAKILMAEKEAVSEVDNKINLPVIFQPVLSNYCKIMSIFLGFIIICMSFIIFSNVFIKYQPFKIIYEKLAIYDARDLNLQDFVMIEENDALLVKGIIVNNSLSQKMLPNIRYIILDKDKNIIARVTKSLTEPSLNPGEDMVIEARITSLNAKYVQIDIGNKLDLLMR